MQMSFSAERAVARSTGQGTTNPATAAEEIAYWFSGTKSSAESIFEALALRS